MSDDPDGWRSDRSIMDWVGLFFAEMRWTLDEMHQGVPDTDLEDLEASKKALRDRVAAAALTIPTDGSDRAVQLLQIRTRMDNEIDAVASPKSLADTTDRIAKFEGAVKQLVAAPPVAPFDADVRSAQAKAALTALRISADFLPDKRRTFSAQKKALGDRIGTATDKAAFDAIDAEIATLAKSVADQAGVVAARLAADRAVAQAREKFDVVRPVLDRGGLIHLEQSFGALVAQWHGAASLSDFQQIKAKADAFVVLAGQGETFGTFFSSWFEATIALIGTSVAEADRDTAKTDRRAAMDAAITCSKVGDFAGADTALRAYAPGGVTAPTDQQNITDFLAKLATIDAQHSGDLEVISASWLRNSGEMDNALKTIRKDALKNRDYAAQSLKLDAFAHWVVKNLPLARAISKHQQSMQAVPEFRQIIGDMETLRRAKDWDAALVKLNEINADPALKKRSDSLTYDKVMEKRYEVLLKKVVGAQRVALKAAWDKHKKAVDEGRFDDAETALVELRALFIFEDLAALREKERAAVKQTPKIADYKYLDQYKAHGKAQRYVQAKAEIERVLTLLPELSAYIAQLERARSLLAALPADPPMLRGTLDAAITAAEVKAHAQKPDEALADLDAVLRQGDYETLFLEMADFDRRLAKVEKQQAKVLKFIELAEPLTKLNAQLDAAKALASPGLQFDAAFDKLTKHSELLVEALKYATTRRQAKGTKAAIERVVAQSGEPEATIFPVGKSFAEIQTAFDKAEAKAKQTQFEEARKLYETLIKDCRGMTVQAVNFYEAADAKEDCNAGHSIGRHGPQLTEEQLIERLRSGKAADWAPGKNLSFTGASSKFKTMEDWLAGRELGAEMAKEKNGIDVGATKLGKDPDTGVFIEPVAQKFVIDHGKPIDEAFVGRKKNLSYVADTGELREDRTYETYEALTGITKTRVNFTWEFKKINGDKPTSVADYVTKFKAANAGAEPTEIEGRWVMMQQFPECDGWDEELQDYVLKDEEGG